MEPTAMVVVKIMWETCRNKRVALRCLESGSSVRLSTLFQPRPDVCYRAAATQIRQSCTINANSLTAFHSFNQSGPLSVHTDDYECDCRREFLSEFGKSMELIDCIYYSPKIDKGLTCAPAYEVLELITTLTILPYFPKYSCRFRTSVSASRLDKPTTKTRFFCTTLRRTERQGRIEMILNCARLISWHGGWVVSMATTKPAKRTRDTRRFWSIDGLTQARWLGQPWEEGCHAPDVGEMTSILGCFLLSRHILLSAFLFYPR